MKMLSKSPAASVAGGVRSRLQTALLIGLIISLCAAFLGFSDECESIRENVLRLHILANSDSPQDQTLKVQVRDRLLTDSAHLYTGAMSEAEAADRARSALPLLRASAEAEIAARGYSYPVSVTVGPAYFGTREYEDFTLPAGEYEAVRVVIGKGAGKNWWCMMFPALCLPAAAKDEPGLDDVFSESQQEIVKNAPKYEFRFKTLEIIEDLKKRFSK